MNAKRLTNWTISLIVLSSITQAVPADSDSVGHAEQSLVPHAELAATQMEWRSLDDGTRIAVHRRGGATSAPGRIPAYAPDQVILKLVAGSNGRAGMQVQELSTMRLIDPVRYAIKQFDITPVDQDAFIKHAVELVDG